MLKVCFPSDASAGTPTTQPVRFAKFARPRTASLPLSGESRFLAELSRCSVPLVGAIHLHRYALTLRTKALIRSSGLAIEDY